MLLGLLNQLGQITSLKRLISVCHKDDHTGVRSSVTNRLRLRRRLVGKTEVRKWNSDSIAPIQESKQLTMEEKELDFLLFASG